MEYLEIILKGITDPNNWKFLDKYLLREFKKAEKENYDIDEFCSGCMRVVDSFEANLQCQLDERKKELYWILNDAKNRNDSESIEYCQCELKEISLHNYYLNFNSHTIDKYAKNYFGNIPYSTIVSIKKEIKILQLSKLSEKLDELGKKYFSEKNEKSTKTHYENEFVKFVDFRFKIDENNKIIGLSELYHKYREITKNLLIEIKENITLQPKEAVSVYLQRIKKEKERVFNMINECRKEDENYNSPRKLCLSPRLPFNSDEPFKILNENRQELDSFFNNLFIRNEELKNDFAEFFIQPEPDEQRTIVTTIDTEKYDTDEIYKQFNKKLFTCSKEVFNDWFVSGVGNVENVKFEDTKLRQLYSLIQQIVVNPSEAKISYFNIVFGKKIKMNKVGNISFQLHYKTKLNLCKK